MLKFLVIDESLCKKELDLFLKKQKRSVRLLANSQELVKQLNSLATPANYPDKFPKKLAVNTTESITLLNIDDITRCESNRNYTFIYLAGKKKLIASKTLMEFEEVLGKYSFLRIHKSHLINIRYMDKYVKTEGGYMMMQDGTKLPVAIRKKEYLFRELEKL